MTGHQLPTIAWRVRVVMAERNIRTARTLRKRLAEHGVVLSEPQLGRVINQLPQLLNTQVLAALCAALDATPGELLVIPGRRPITDSLGLVPEHHLQINHQMPASAPTASRIDLTATPSSRPRAKAFPRPKY